MLVHFHVIFVQLFMAKRLTPAAAHSGLTSASPCLVPTPAHSCSICSHHLVRIYSILFCRLWLLHLRVSFNRNHHFHVKKIKIESLRSVSCQSPVSLLSVSCHSPVSLLSLSCHFCLMRASSLWQNIFPLRTVGNNRHNCQIPASCRTFF